MNICSRVADSAAMARDAAMANNSVGNVFILYCNLLVFVKDCIFYKCTTRTSIGFKILRFSIYESNVCLAIENKESISVTFMWIIIDLTKIYFEVVSVRTDYPRRTLSVEAVVKM